LQFRIKEATPVTPITLTYDLADDDIHNFNLQPVNFAVVNGSVTSETVTSSETGISEIGVSEIGVSEGITLVDPVNKAILRAYPNPLLRGTTLYLDGVVEGSLIEIYNLSGTCVYRTIAVESPASFILNIPAGVYIVRTNSGAIRIVVNN